MQSKRASAFPFFWEHSLIMYHLLQNISKSCFFPTNTNFPRIYYSHKLKLFLIDIKARCKFILQAAFSTSKNIDFLQKAKEKIFQPHALFAKRCTSVAKASSTR